MDLEGPTSWFDDTFQKGSTTVTPPALLPHGNEVTTDVDVSSNDVTGSEEVLGSITPPIVS